MANASYEDFGEAQRKRLMDLGGHFEIKGIDFSHDSINISPEWAIHNPSSWAAFVAGERFETVPDPRS